MLLDYIFIWFMILLFSIIRLSSSEKKKLEKDEKLNMPEIFIDGVMLAFFGFLLFLLISLIASTLISSNDDLLTEKLVKTYSSVEKVDENSENYLDIIYDNKIKIIAKKDEYKTIKTFNVLRYEVLFEETSTEPRIEIYEYEFKNKTLGKFFFCIKTEKIIVYDYNVEGLKNKIIVP